MPEKVTISYRGAKYEIGQGKRYYGIWLTGAPESDPLDRWPLTTEGWTQAWARLVSIERPGTIVKVEKPRTGVKFPRVRRSGAAADTTAATSAPTRAIASAGLLGLGVLLGLIGLFPGYIGSQSLASQAYQLVPHLLYLLTWVVSAALVAAGAWRGPAERGVPGGRPPGPADRRPATPRLGALLGAGLGAVTFGLYFADLGQVISAGSSLLGAGMVLTLLGWLACTAGSLLALTVRPRPAMPGPAVGAPSAVPQPDPAPDVTGPYLPGPPFAASPVSRGRPGAFGPVRPRLADAGPLALVLLAAIGAVATFVPSWDSYTLTQSTNGISQTITAGYAFANPGWVIAGNVAVMVAVIAVAVLAALWRPVRHGAVLLTGATVALIAQGISALLQVTEPTTPAQFGISQAQASAAGLTISSGLTPIFWVYCVFVISLVVSIAWMLTTPHYLAMPATAQSPHPGPADQAPSADSETSADSENADTETVDTETADSETADSDGEAEDNAESSYA